MLDSQDIESKVQSLLNQGAYFQAHNLATDAINDTPSVRLVQLLASTETKLGNPDRTIELLRPLFDKNPDDAESAGILARAYKDIFRETGDQGALNTSASIYRRNYEQSKSYYTGINAATMAFVAGDKDLCRTISKAVLGLITTSDYWALATKAEALLLLGAMEESAHCYSQAISIANNNWGQLNSTRQQLEFLDEYLQVPDSIWKLFKAPSLVIFTGHMIDHPDRSSPRFPVEIEEEVTRQIQDKITKLNVDIGYTSLACGADIIFVESLLNAGKEVRLFMPFSETDFRKTSIDFAEGNWNERFDTIINSQPLNFVTDEPYLESDSLFHFMGKIMMGQALNEAALYRTSPTLLSVLSDQNERKTGGTSDIVDMWPDRHRWVNIDPSEFLDKSGSSRTTLQPVSTPSKANRDVRYILFSDIVGFSKMDEINTPDFIHVVLKEIGQIFNSGDFNPDVVNTWGDAIMIAHNNAHELVDFAFKLLALFKFTDWQARGFPGNTDIRIALHAGPVFMAKDPLTRRNNIYGTHVNKAARIEPVTLPGAIYASDQFTSCLTVESYEQYDFHHVGIVELPKKFGKQEIYRISAKKA